MESTRREFVVVSAALVLTGCVTEPKEPAAEPAPLGRATVDAGPAGDYARDGVYDAFREQGFFVVRAGEKLLALSSECTHRRCRVQQEAGGGFSCRCHGARFDEGGRVVKGPATRDLPRLKVVVDGSGHLRVTAGA